MNILLLSPHFPPNFKRFAMALKELGATVLAIGDSPQENLSQELKASLSDYYHLDNLSDYDQLYRATALMIHKHGRIDRVDSHNEHWLGVEAQLRQDFQIFGQRPEDLAFNRRKSGMKDIFRQADVPAPPGEPVVSTEQVRSFVAKHGFPVIFKPDIGVGAGRIFRVDNEGQLGGVLEYLPKDFFIEAFVSGDLISFDGLTDRDGGIIFCASHKVNSGIMEIIAEQKPVHYFYDREIPPLVEEYGCKLVKAFRIRERFFHAEFLMDSHHRYLALEINVRPPGGYSLDMMNWSCDIDLYRAWASCIVRGESHFHYERRYCVAHVARREKFRYQHSHEDVLRNLSGLILEHLPFPQLFRSAMGDYVYFLRHHDKAVLLDAIAFIEDQAT